MKRTLLLTALLVSALLAPAAAEEAPAIPLPAKKQARRTIDLAICLDTSNSMDGLIDSARARIWGIVNDLALAQPTPNLRVAVLSFGNQTYDANAGWVRLDTGFTDDLDMVSKKLFELQTSGGTELVGRVLQGALAQLSWSSDPAALKLIVVAGNESADQDKTVSFRLMCRRAIERGIMVNSIYCGSPADAIAPGWQEVARLSDGHFSAIDQQAGARSIPTPFDPQLAQLSGSLNSTYVPFAAKGRAGAEEQARQDHNNARLSPAAAASRANAKGSALYVCNWCLVDATRNGQIKLEEVKLKDLPKNMQAMTPAARKTYIDEVFAKRQAIQEKIKKLHGKRQAFLVAERKKLNKKGEEGFGAAVRKAIRAQAKSKGFAFTEE